MMTLKLVGKIETNEGTLTVTSGGNLQELRNLAGELAERDDIQVDGILIEVPGDPGEG